MKELLKGKIISAEELAKRITADGETGITYDDIKDMFSKEDLAEYDRLCKCFINIVGGKSNEEQWEIIMDSTGGLELVSALNRIQELREKYRLPGVFHRLWSAKPLENGKFEYNEISW